MHAEAQCCSLHAASQCVLTDKLETVGSTKSLVHCAAHSSRVYHLQDAARRRPRHDYLALGVTPLGVAHGRRPC